MISIHWATCAVDELKTGRDVTIYSKCDSIIPKIKTDAEITLEPVTYFEGLQKGDVVLTSSGQNIYLHLVGNLDKNRIQVANKKGKSSWFIKKNDVYGRVISINNS